MRKYSDGKIYAMKILKKDQLIEKNLMDKTQAERMILAECRSPYIVRLHYAFQTQNKLYFIIDFLNGGELFTYLKNERIFSEQRTRIYAAELVEALAYLHKHGVIYRDLKPENILLGSDGHLKITDFGLSKLGLGRESRTFSFCGTPEYLAPEVIRGDGHSFEVDWWSLGALVYEMLVGAPPHFSKDKTKMLKKIVEVEIPMTSSKLSADAKSFLQMILDKDPEKRLGGYKSTDTYRGSVGLMNEMDDADEIRAHPFFSNIDWEQMKMVSHNAPFIPPTSGETDTSCIDTYFT